MIMQQPRLFLQKTSANAL